MHFDDMTFVSLSQLSNNGTHHQNIVLTMIEVSNSNKTSYRNGCQSRTDAYI
jgi:hypothetical protein